MGALPLLAGSATMTPAVRSSAAAEEPTSPVLEVRGLTKHFPVGRHMLHAADDVNLTIGRGETLGLVGESGSGKSTVGRCILRLEPPTAGDIRLNGRSVSNASTAELRRMRARMQMVFQDPYDSLNPRMRLGKQVAEPMWLSGVSSRRDAERRAVEAFEMVHLPPEMADRYAHQLSGGQQQRVGIARALGTGPDLIVLDEPTSALDVSVQAQIINLLGEIKATVHAAYLFISHDLSVVSNLADRVAVMYLGQIVELGDTETIFDRPAHPYTRGLISAAPVEHPGEVKTRLALQGEPTSPLDPPTGCRLAGRCPFAQPSCVDRDVELQEVKPGHAVRCRRFVEENIDGIWEPDVTSWRRGKVQP